MQIILRLATIMVCMCSLAVDAKIDSPDKTYDYNETKWLIQIFDNNRATVYEGRSEVGGLTLMLNILERYVHSMEAGSKDDSHHSMELHFFSESGSKVLLVGDSWIRDGELVSAMAPADYNELLRFGRFRDDDATRILEWIERRNAFYKRRIKRNISAFQTSSDMSQTIKEKYEVANIDSNTDDHSSSHVAPLLNNLAATPPDMAMIDQVLQSESISNSSISSVINQHNESPQQLKWLILPLLGYAMILLIVVATTMLIIMYQRR